MGNPSLFRTRLCFSIFSPNHIQDEKLNAFVRFHTEVTCYRYVDRPLSGGIAKIDCRQSIEGEKGKKKKKRKIRKKKKRRKRNKYLLSRAVLARTPSPPMGDFCPAGNHFNHITHVNGGSLLVFQLQLQRNEVIALMNLLNRLSESVKFVHDKGPYAERIVGGKISPPTSKNSL
ncbi:hypothetical protein GW17_00022807 [Ensete ventricosum]|nr:hypothetical protein GW17_00022807 [Ensete ventricosum]